ncbi:hypothetical protein MLD38_037991 [Melastoma candidum]|uniref:Uncharacterized protein n=1 Tax=Melastoma candidum TaxID=119954 RepID=A0ACB9KYM7_9MYRT|nr:hypothetical protein MLD38_037991 [Melastoma candidum]
MMSPQQSSNFAPGVHAVSGLPPITGCPENGPPHSEPVMPSSRVVSPSLMDHDSNCDYEAASADVSSKFSFLRRSLYPVTLKFQDVVYSIIVSDGESSCFGTGEPKTSRTILNGVTGIARPGELLAMLGPSGSGKTTLLTALAGRLPGKIAGIVTYNGHPFSSYVKRKTGIVTQDDVLYPHLTVGETLTYAAMLRLPKELTGQEKAEQAEMVMAELGLSARRHSMVGGPVLRGVSGGERKRVSIGQELLINPSLLFLDEPTSGLDSTTAQRIVMTLRGLARGGRTIVMTIHQPSTRLYQMFDKVLVLSDGSPIYSGRANRAMEYFGSIGYVPAFNYVNPADFLLDLANGIRPVMKRDNDHPQQHDHELNLEAARPNDPNSIKQSLISSFKRNLDPALKAEIGQNAMSFQDGRQSAKAWSSGRGPRNESKWTTTWWDQFRVLLCRGLKERRHESYSGLRIFQVLSVSVLAGLLWWHSDTSNMQDQIGLLFFYAIFWGFFPLFNAIFTFPQERPILVKERSSGMYRLSSYYFARIVGDLPMELVLPTIFVTISYWMGGLKPSLATFTLTLMVILLNVLLSQGLGLALGAILMDVKQGATLASVTMLVFLLAGGYYIQHMPSFAAWLKYISFSYYCYKLLIGVQYSKAELYECGPGMHCRVMDFPAVKCLSLGDMHWDIAIMVIMLVGYRFLAYMALRMRELH